MSSVLSSSGDCKERIKYDSQVGILKNLSIIGAMTMDIQIIKREMERVPWQHLPLHRLSEKTQRAPREHSTQMQQYIRGGKND